MLYRDCFAKMTAIDRPQQVSIRGHNVTGTTHENDFSNAANRVILLVETNYASNGHGSATPYDHVGNGPAGPPSRRRVMAGPCLSGSLENLDFCPTSGKNVAPHYPQAQRYPFACRIRESSTS